MNIQIGPTVKHEWNVAMHVLQQLFRVFHKHNSLPLGLIQPSSPSTKEQFDVFNICIVLVLLASQSLTIDEKKSTFALEKWFFEIVDVPKCFLSNRIYSLTVPKCFLSNQIYSLNVFWKFAVQKSHIQRGIRQDLECPKAPKKRTLCNGNFLS